MEKKSAFLQTERLLLRPLEEKDRQQMVSILCNAEIKKTYMLPDFKNQKEAEALFERIMDFSRRDDHFVYGICYQNEVIGFLNDCEMKDSMIELGYVIEPRYQRRGFATEALGSCIDELFRMGFDRVRTGYFQENTASGRVMQKCGMHKIEFEEEIEYRGISHHCLYYEIDKPVSFISSHK